jgi:hypothetical protein
VLEPTPENSVSIVRAGPYRPSDRPGSFSPTFHPLSRGGEVLGVVCIGLDKNNALSLRNITPGVVLNLPARVHATAITAVEHESARRVVFADGVVVVVVEA